MLGHFADLSDKGYQATVYLLYVGRAHCHKKRKTTSNVVTAEY